MLLCFLIKNMVAVKNEVNIFPSSVLHPVSVENDTELLVPAFRAVCFDLFRLCCFDFRRLFARKRQLLLCLLLAAAVLGLILSIVLRTVFGSKAMSAFGEHVPALLIYPYNLSLVWRNLKYGLRYKFANKLDFTTHKQ